MVGALASGPGGPGVASMHLKIFKVEQNRVNNVKFSQSCGLNISRTKFSLVTLKTTISTIYAGVDLGRRLRGLRTCIQVST